MGAKDSFLRRAVDFGRGVYAFTERVLTAITPLIGITDSSDVEYLRGALRRDIAWIDSLLAGTEGIVRAKSADGRAEAAALRAAELTRELTAEPAKQAGQALQSAAEATRRVAREAATAPERAEAAGTAAKEATAQAAEAEVKTNQAAAEVKETEGAAAAELVRVASEIRAAAEEAAIAVAEVATSTPATARNKRLGELRTALETLCQNADSAPRVARGWTDYGAYRLAILANVPPDARCAALEELRMMKGLILDDSKARWDALAAQVDELLVNHPSDGAIPFKLQELWREIDFARALRRSRVEKFTRTTQYTWVLLVVATSIAVTHLSWRGPTEHGVYPYIVAALGFLGGAVSALRSVDSLHRPERTSAEVESVKLRLRPYVGAMAATVLFVIARSGLVFEIGTSATSGARLQILLPPDQIKFAYYALAFVAGFSERILLSIADYAGDRIAPNGGKQKAVANAQSAPGAVANVAAKKSAQP